jgi:hypothetical protein
MLAEPGTPECTNQLTELFELWLSEWESDDSRSFQSIRLGAPAPGPACDTTMGLREVTALGTAYTRLLKGNARPQYRPD